MTLSTIDLQEMLAVARNVTNDVEPLLYNATGARSHVKGPGDIVTDNDRAIERQIRAALREATPNIDFLGEEYGGTTDDTTTRWILDPIDGTANYARGLPMCGISLALVAGRTPLLGVINLPYLHRHYWAAAGLGAWCNSKQLRPAETRELTAAMVALGDAGTGTYAAERNRVSLALHEHLATRAQRIRMLGSSAVDLAFVADGSLDVSLTLGNRAWDMAAGAVIAREAGAAVMDTDGTDHTTASYATIATAPGLRDAVLALLKTTTANSRWAPDRPRKDR